MNTSYPQPWYLGEGSPGIEELSFPQRTMGCVAFPTLKTELACRLVANRSKCLKSQALSHANLFAFQAISTKLQPFFLFCPLQLPVPACHSLPSPECQASRLLFNTRIQCKLAAYGRDFPKPSNFPFSPVEPLIAQALPTQAAAAFFLTQ